MPASAIFLAHPGGGLSSPTLRWALACSLGLHGLLLALGSWQQPTLPAVPQVVQVALSGGRPAAVDNSVRKSVDSAPAPVLPKEKARASGAVLSTPSSREAAPLLVPAASAPVAAGLAPTAESGRPAPSSGQAGSVGERTGAVAREGVNAEVLTQYRLALGLEARRFKRYPRLARERGWEGRVELRIQVLPGGAVVPVVQRGSGFAVLDEQALEMLERAIRATPLPEALRGRSLQLELPIAFSLNDD